MKAFAVYVNGELVCTAGVGADGHVSADASWLGDDGNGGFLQVGGVDGDQHVKWCFRQLQVGDDVRIVVEETDRVDEPNERRSREEMDRWAEGLRPRPI